MTRSSYKIEINLYSRLLASKVDCSALLSSSYSAVEGILGEISAAGRLLDVTPAGPSCWNLRFTGEGIGRYIVEKREVELSLSTRWDNNTVTRIQKCRLWSLASRTYL